MTSVVPWIGYQFTDELYAELLEDGLDIQIERELHLADKGLKMVTNTAYPLIIVSDVIAPGSLELPHNIALDAYSEISCHVIRTIRESGPNKDTPIVAAVVPSGNYVVPQRYLDSGASHVFDKTANHNPSAFTQVVGEYLKINPKSN